MKKLKTFIYYALILGVFSAVMYGIVTIGKNLEQGRAITNLPASGDSLSAFITSFLQNLKSPLALLIAQLVVIIVAARFVGWLCRKIGQPSVMGEIIAGIVLGPSLLGHFFPGFSAALFPAASLSTLKFLSQIGLILFMFIVGMELNLATLRSKAHEAVVISHASIIVPFTLGMGLAYFMYTAFAPANVPFVSFALFTGIAMSITAFPVLARIVQERDIYKTQVGSVVITCAAVDDITAWCILAVVIAIVKAGSISSAVYVILLAVAYVAVMIKLVRPFLTRLGYRYGTQGLVDKTLVAVFILTLLASCFVTEAIGIHALFGAFMMGAIMPENVRFRTIFIEKIEDVAVVLLLPLFFVFSGLRTEIGLLDSLYLWKVTAVIILVAITGKFVGSALTAKVIGQSWKDSLTIGALMNTRGLMELVALNIGYDLKLLSPSVFTMMVIMALVTTFMTGPALDFINRFFKDTGPSANPEALQQAIRYKVLLSFKGAESGSKLVRLANSMISKLNGNATVTAMHLADETNLNNYSAEVYEQQSFTPVFTEARLLNQQLTTVFKVSNNIPFDTLQLSEKGDYDLLLLEPRMQLFETNLLAKSLGFKTAMAEYNRNSVADAFDDDTNAILQSSKIPVGIICGKEAGSINQIVVPVLSSSDQLLLPYLQRFISSNAAQVTVIDYEGLLKTNVAFKEALRMIEQTAPNHLRIENGGKTDTEELSKYDLILVSITGWNKLIKDKQLSVDDLPSVLVISLQSQ